MVVSLTVRQQKILSLIRTQGSASNKEIVEKIPSASRITIVRDITQLLKQGIIVQTGKGRSTRYIEHIQNELLQFIDADHYFAKGPDERTLRFDRFEFSIFQKLESLFTTEELQHLQNITTAFRNRLKRLSTTTQKKEFERLTIEFSWKSSHIEGNTYSLLDTELLIKKQEEAVGHTKEEAIMILNHKKAIDYVLRTKNQLKKPSALQLRNVHRLLVADLGVPTGIRKRPVGITGTLYRPLDNEHQITEAVEKMMRAIRKTKDPFSKAFIALSMIPAIQPFEDGNKRTSRLFANGLLLACNSCPLSFRSIDERSYMMAVLLLYEQQNALLLKKLFIEQYQFAVENYFL